MKLTLPVKLCNQLLADQVKKELGHLTCGREQAEQRTLQRDASTAMCGCGFTNSSVSHPMEPQVRFRPLTLSLALAIRIRLGLLLQCKLPPKRAKSLPGPRASDFEFHVKESGPLRGVLQLAFVVKPSNRQGHFLELDDLRPRPKRQSLLIETLTRPWPVLGAQEKLV